MNNETNRGKEERNHKERKQRKGTKSTLKAQGTAKTATYIVEVSESGSGDEANSRSGAGDDDGVNANGEGDGGGRFLPTNETAEMRLTTRASTDRHYSTERVDLQTINSPH